MGSRRTGRRAGPSAPRVHPQHRLERGEFHRGDAEHAAHAREDGPGRRTQPVRLQRRLELDLHEQPAQVAAPRRRDPELAEHLLERVLGRPGFLPAGDLVAFERALGGGAAATP